MTDKIVDGINVSECTYVYTDRYNDLCCHSAICKDSPCKSSEMLCSFYVDHLKTKLEEKEHELIMAKADLCKGCQYKNDYKTKEQECENVKNWIKSKMFYTDCDNWFERFVFAFNDWQDELTKQLDQLKAENETYKKMLDNSEFRVALTDVKTSERQVWRKLGDKAQKYKQALDEIEEVCKNGVYNEFRMPLDECSVILNIINKAKGQ